MIGMIICLIIEILCVALNVPGMLKGYGPSIGVGLFCAVGVGWVVALIFSTLFSDR